MLRYVYPILLQPNLGKHFSNKIWRYDQVRSLRYEKYIPRPVRRAFWHPCRKSYLFLVIRKDAKESSARRKIKEYTLDCSLRQWIQVGLWILHSLPKTSTQRVCAKVCKLFKLTLIVLCTANLHKACPALHAVCRLQRVLWIKSIHPVPSFSCSVMLCYFYSRIEVLHENVIEHCPIRGLQILCCHSHSDYATHHKSSMDPLPSPSGAIWESILNRALCRQPPPVCSRTIFTQAP